MNWANMIKNVPTHPWHDEILYFFRDLWLWKKTKQGLFSMDFPTAAFSAEVLSFSLPHFRLIAHNITDFSLNGNVPLLYCQHRASQYTNKNWVPLKACHHVYYPFVMKNCLSSRRNSLKWKERLWMSMFSEQ